MKGVKASADGNSPYVKNLMGTLWTPEQLAQRTCIGKAPTVGAKEAKPECTPNKTILFFLNVGSKLTKYLAVKFLFVFVK